MELVLELEAFGKLILHATKYPSFGVNGILIRKIGKGPKENQTVIHFEDAIPLTHIHMSKFCTPTMEIAFAQVEQHCKDTKSEVVGYYQANPNIDDKSPDFVTIRLAEKLNEVYPNLIVFMLDNEKMDANLETVPLIAYKFSDGKLKPQEARIQLVPDEQGSLSTVSALIQAKAYRELVDFDDHLENLSLCYWTNKKVTEAIKLFNKS